MCTSDLLPVDLAAEAFRRGEQEEAKFDTQNCGLLSARGPLGGRAGAALGPLSRISAPLLSN